MKKAHIIATLPLAAFVGACTHIPEEPPEPTAKIEMECIPYGAAADGLDDEFEEKIIGRGLSFSGGILELTVSDGGLTWVLVGTEPAGRSCLLSFGWNWDQLGPHDD